MNEYHVCGMVLLACPDQASSVAQALEAMPGVALHASDRGRLIVTVEGDGYQQCADTMNRLALLSGIASSSLVYHEIETDSLPEESSP